MRVPQRVRGPARDQPSESNGRSIDEFVHLVKAMQTSDQHKVTTPEAWQPGDKVIVPPPATAEAAAAGM